jgi:formylglycine-generating enzyme required for sulfatase activity
MVSWRLVIAILLVWSGALQPVAAADARNLIVEGRSQRLALVIGNDSYRHVPKLDNARADARALAKALEAAGFVVTLKLDVDQKAMERALRAFKAQLVGGDEAVFYFSGHGVQLAGENFLLPVDIGGQTADQVRDDAVGLQRVLDDLHDQKARFSLAIIDACRDNPFKGLGKAIGGRGLAATAPATGQMVIYAAGTGQQALDRLNEQDRNPNGLFAREFLKEMSRPGVPVSQVLRNVRSEVVRLARTVGHEQVPALYDQAIGDFYFRPPVDEAPAHAPVVTAPPLAARAAYASGTVFRDCPDCPEMVAIPAGEFSMGSPASEEGRGKDEGPQHQVRIGKAFALGRKELTVGEFGRFVQASGYRTSAEKDAGKGCYAWDKSDGKWDWRAGRKWSEPGYAQGEQQPVACVSWDDARAYVQWLAKETGQGYRLPSEAEWEYAARAGGKTARPWGDNPKDACSHANVADNTTYEGTSWELKHDCSDGYWFPAPVASYQANRFGLYDMIGNVWEWVQDCYQDSYTGAPADGSAREGGKCEARVLRGGSWDGKPQYARSAFRFGDAPANRFNVSGFRLARTLP